MVYNQPRQNKGVPVEPGAIQHLTPQSVSGQAHTSPQTLVDAAVDEAGLAGDRIAGLALAAVNTNDPRKALVFLGAASAKTALDHDMAQGFIEQMAQEHRSLSVTSNKNWGQQLQDNKKMVEDINQLAEENKKLTERLERLEVITKQIVATVVQQNGGSVDEVASMLQNLGI